MIKVLTEELARTDERFPIIAGSSRVAHVAIEGSSAGRPSRLDAGHCPGGVDRKLRWSPWPDAWRILFAM
jgi:hypothetical protein